MAEYYEPSSSQWRVHKARFSLNAYTISAQTRLVHTRCDTIQSGCDFDPQGDDLCTETPHTSVVCQWSIKCIRCKVAAHKWLQAFLAAVLSCFTTPPVPLSSRHQPLWPLFPHLAATGPPFPPSHARCRAVFRWAIALATSTWRICTLRRAEATPLGSPTARARWQIFYSQRAQ